jgi:hypothetical protein
LWPDRLAYASGGVSGLRDGGWHSRLGSIQCSAQSGDIPLQRKMGTRLKMWLPWASKISRPTSTMTVPPSGRNDQADFRVRTFLQVAEDLPALDLPQRDSISGECSPATVWSCRRMGFPAASRSSWKARVPLMSGPSQARTGRSSASCIAWTHHPAARSISRPLASASFNALLPSPAALLPQVRL